MKVYKIKNRDKDHFVTFGNNKIYLVDYINNRFIKTDNILDIKNYEFTPIFEPTKIVCVGLNYIDHAKELNMDTPNAPIIFIKPISSIIHENENIKIPNGVGRVDYEAELAFIISKKCKNITPNQANDYILGYTCFNDVTARDIQKIDGQWTRAKSYDTFAPIASFVETEIKDPNNLNIKAILNGKIVQNSNSSNFIFKVEELLSFISNVMTLYPGDIISTGTPPGIGPLQKGDKIEIEIEKIGTLTNFVD